MTIVQAQTSDFLSIAALDRSAWKQNRESEFIPDGEHVWRIWVEHALVYVAKVGPPGVVGAVVAFPCVSGSYCLHKVCVEREYRGKGIGSSLVAALLDQTDRLHVDCFLTVDPFNESALRLYAKWGFTDKLLVKGFYRRNEDRFVLTRRFRP